MQNKIIPSILTAALLSVSSIALAGGPEVFPEPDYFSGFYVGGFGGVMHATFHGGYNSTLTQPITIFNIPVVQPGVLQSNSINGGAWSGLGGIQGGYGMEINHMFYVGVQGWGWWGDASNSETTFAATPFTPVRTGPGGLFTVSQAASASSTTTVRVRDNAGVAAKLGWVVAPGSMIYGKLGANWASLKVSESSSSSTTNSIVFNGTTRIPPFTVFSRTVTTESNSNSGDQVKIGLATAIGFEQFVYQDVASINVEAGYTNYGHVSTTGQVSGVSSTTIFGIPLPAQGFLTNIFNTASADAKVSTLTAGINFYFGRNSFGI